MKAMVIDDSKKGLQGLKLNNVEEASAPQAGEITVRLKASSLNYHDYGVVSGGASSAQGRIPLADGAGVIEAVGEGVSEFKPGDAVVSCFFPDWLKGAPEVADFAQTPGDGIDGYARDMVTVPARYFTKAPAGWAHTEAATITTAGLTAWRALVVESKLKAGDKVLLLGTGGVSIYALKIAKAMGAQVAITSSSDAKLKKAKALGADFTVNYKQDEEWGRTVKKWAGKGVDLVVEVGGPGTLAQSIDACRIGGNIVLIGVLTGVEGKVPTATLMQKQITLSGIVVGSRQMQNEFVRGLEGLKITPEIDKTFPLDALAEAFKYEESGEHFGKIAIEI
ncbi:NAD(P)-dependent alcohol dehydrogenase [Alteromonas pelagimontana]|uniref:NAD(P)-dependent alcohol dehydrogenase n=1 Tax=Alteromonas pelagimontana TaxID=1858656 RepID=A0A6M4MG68_9ALTE|nr:NAD(P)-dependent alcohol dehydrogenase [Alteromonas pelagimontana]QJR81937.1 NAD(P)-dependent alcohol dehydrogenase [Alteromonas pelagimontana]